MSSNLSINKWAEDDRPREKLMKYGVSALTDAELLAILIGSGYAETDAVMLMKNILNSCNNNLNALGRMTIDELMAFKGIGVAKAVSILAACEIGRRRALSRILEREELSCAEDIYRFVHSKIGESTIENGWAVYLNTAYKLVKAIEISRGGITETAVDVRIVIKEALLCNATIVVFCHNHPSNNMNPSLADDKLTKQLQEACNYLRLYFLDHIIIGDGKYYSYREEGRLVDKNKM